MVKKEKIAIGRLDGMRNDLLHANKKIRIGFVGGGPNSFIGYTHRLAARFDNRFEFVAGVFSKNIKNQKISECPSVLILNVVTQIIYQWQQKRVKSPMEFKPWE